MKAVILAGGMGSRLSEETQTVPKPLIDIGGKPIIWHVMKLYSFYGINDFIICCGYKGYLIKEYFANYLLHASDVTIDLEKDRVEIHHRKTEPWRITLLDTGEQTMTGGRLKQAKSYIGHETFCMTYGDGVADVNILALLNFHKKQGVLATVTAVKPPGRFGSLLIAENKVICFKEKADDGGGWINSGFFVLEPEILDYIEGDQTVFEFGPLENLAKQGQLVAYQHHGFWHGMDTLRDKNLLENLWRSSQAAWRVWT